MHQPCANGGPPPQHVNGDGPARNGDLAAPASGTAPGLCMSQTDQEIVRLIGQHLNSIGLERSAALVMEESGLHLEHPAAGRLRAHVLAGDWSKAEHDLRALHELLRGAGGCEPRALQEMKFVVLEQKYLEHLEAGRALDALHVLRNELTPLGHDTARVHRLSALMMCGSAGELRARARRPTPTGFPSRCWRTTTARRTGSRCTRCRCSRTTATRSGTASGRPTAPSSPPAPRTTPSSSGTSTPPPSGSPSGSPWRGTRTACRTWRGARTGATCWPRGPRTAPTSGSGTWRRSSCTSR